jgi:hypothetical protein
MAEHAETVEFWKGVVVGTFFGLLAAAYARGDFRRLLSISGSVEPLAEPVIEHPKEKRTSGAEVSAVS